MVIRLVFIEVSHLPSLLQPISGLVPLPRKFLILERSRRTRTPSPLANKSYHSEASKAIVEIKNGSLM